MTYLEIITIAVALSLDAFSVAICKGLSLKNSNLRNAIVVGAYFGVFQALMPMLGYLLANTFLNSILNIDEIIAFALLTIIGLQMIINNFRKKDDEIEEYENDKDSLSLKVMIPLAIATSIDALAVGVSFAMLKINIFEVVIFIGSITFILSSIAVKIGGFIGEKFKKYSEIIGGLVLIVIGVRILLTGN